LQTRQTVDRGDVDTYFVKYQRSKAYIIIITVIRCKQRHFAFHNVVRRYCTPKFVAVE